MTDRAQDSPESPQDALESKWSAEMVNFIFDAVHAQPGNGGDEDMDVLNDAFDHDAEEDYGDTFHGGGENEEGGGDESGDGESLESRWSSEMVEFMLQAVNTSSSSGIGDSSSARGVSAFSTYDSSINQERKKKRKKRRRGQGDNGDEEVWIPGVPAFLMKLFCMLERGSIKSEADDETVISVSDYLSWSSDGASIVVKAPKKSFEDNLLPHAFPRQTKFESFVRQLNIYNFAKERKEVAGSGTEESYLVFRQPNFKRGRSDLLPAIKRKSVVAPLTGPAPSSSSALSSSSSSSSSSASSVSSSSPFIGASIQQPFSCAPLWTSGTSAELMTTNASADTSTSSVVD